MRVWFVFRDSDGPLFLFVMPGLDPGHPSLSLFFINRDVGCNRSWTPANPVKQQKVDASRVDPDFGDNARPGRDGLSGQQTHT